MYKTHSCYIDFQLSVARPFLKHIWDGVHEPFYYIDIIIMVVVWLLKDYFKASSAV
jgi:hypothetical protein